MQPNLTPGQRAHFVWRIEDTLRPELIDAAFTERRNLIEITSSTDLQCEVSSLVLDHLKYELEAVAELSHEGFERYFSKAVEQALQVAARRYPETIVELGGDHSEWITNMKARAHALFIDCSSDVISDDFEKLHFNATLAVRRARQLGLTEDDRNDFVDSIEQWFIAKMERYCDSERGSSLYNLTENLEGAQKLVRLKARMEISLLHVLPKPTDSSAKGFIERQFSATFEGLGIFGDEGNALRIDIERHIASELTKIIRSKDDSSE